MMLASTTAVLIEARPERRGTCCALGFLADSTRVDRRGVDLIELRLDLRDSCELHVERAAAIFDRPPEQIHFGAGDEFFRAAAFHRRSSTISRAGSPSPWRGAP
jgi:hypothetical protein